MPRCQFCETTSLKHPCTTLAARETCINFPPRGLAQPYIRLQSPGGDSIAVLPSSIEAVFAATLETEDGTYVHGKHCMLGLTNGKTVPVAGEFEFILAQIWPRGN